MKLPYFCFLTVKRATSGLMTVSRNFPRLFRAVESLGNTPSLCSIARRAGQPSTSAYSSCLSDQRSYSPCAGRATSACTVTRKLSGLNVVGREAHPLHGALQHYRPVCTFGATAGPLHSNNTLKGGNNTANSSERCTALHAHQQRRCAFGLPNLNGDTSKQYQERRLIGYAVELLAVSTKVAEGPHCHLTLKSIVTWSYLSCCYFVAGIHQSSFLTLWQLWNTTRNLSLGVKGLKSYRRSRQTMWKRNLKWASSCSWRGLASGSLQSFWVLACCSQWLHAYRYVLQ